MNALELIGEKIGIQQTKKPKTFIIVTLIIMMVMMPGITLLMGNIEPSLEKILPQNIKEVKLMNDMRAQYGADMMQIVITTEGPTQDVRDPDVIKYLDLLEQKLKHNNYILETTSLASIVKEINNGIIPESNKEIRKIISIHPQTPAYINYDNSLTIIQIRSDTGATAKTVKEVVEEIENTINSLDEFNPGVKTQITGFNSIDKATFEVIMKDFANITGLSFLLMLLFLIGYFGNVKKVFSSVSIIMISLIITLGIVGYLGLTITVVTMVAAAMIMALGISYGINVTFEYHHIREKQNKKETLIELNKRLVRALTGSSLTTSAGFLALLFGIIPAMKNLGIVLATGIIITLITSIIFLPALIYLMDNKDTKKIEKTKTKKTKTKTKIKRWKKWKQKKLINQQQDF